MRDSGSGNATLSKTTNSQRCNKSGTSHPTHVHVEIDSLLIYIVNTNKNIGTAVTSLKSRQGNQASTQRIFVFIVRHADQVQRTTISIWSEALNSSPQYLFNFVRKALLQQLPTAGNLYRWKKVDSPNCGLCKSGEQSKKHVPSHCSAKCSLTRSTSCHDKISNICLNTIFVSSHMYPENPEGTQVILGSMNMGYISNTARNRTHNLFRPKPQ